MIENSQDVFYAITILCILNMFVFFLLFSRISLRRIEQELQKEGIELCRWDGIGMKAIWAAGAIFFKGTIFSVKNDPLIDTEAVIRNSTVKDRVFASIFYGNGIFLGLISIYHEVFMLS